MCRIHWIVKITCKRLTFLSSFSGLQVIQNKRPWCWAVSYVIAGNTLKTLPEFQANIKLLTCVCSVYFDLDGPCCSTEHLKEVCKKQPIQIIKLDRLGLNLVEPVLGTS